MNERKRTDVLKKDVQLHLRTCRYFLLMAWVKRIVTESNNTPNFCMMGPVDPEIPKRGVHMSTCIAPHS